MPGGAGSGRSDIPQNKFGLFSPLAPGAPGARRGRGVAVHESFHSVAAQVVEVTVGANGSLKVDRVVCAVDCGIAINPDVVRAQMEGGIGFALSTFYGAYVGTAVYNRVRACIVVLKDQQFTSSL